MRVVAVVTAAAMASVVATVATEQRVAVARVTPLEVAKEATGRERRCTWRLPGWR